MAVFENQNTYEYVKSQFAQFGMTSLFAQLELIWQEGFTENDTEVVMSKLSQTTEYKARFSANDARVKKGLSELTPGEYVRLENGYRDLVGTAGLGKFFSSEDFTKFIENDVSAREAESRIATAKSAVDNIDPAYQRSLSEMYGIDQDGIAAYFLNPETATAVFERRHKAAIVKGVANNYGTGIDTNLAEVLGSRGIEQREAMQGFQRVTGQRDDVARLSGIYGQGGGGVTEADLVTEQFGLEGADQVTKKKKKMASQERAAFGGSSGIGQNSLAQRKSGL